jgi:hypothetical protein
METEHEQVQAILAARALGALDDAESGAAEALIDRHLPTCDRCRYALESFAAVAGELALAEPSLRPPQSLQARLRRELAGPRIPARLGALVTAVAAIVALVLGGLSLHLTGRVSRAERAQAQTAELISAVSVPRSKIVPLASGSAGPSRAVAAVYVPGGGHMYVVGNLPKPASHRVYQLWLGKGGSFASGGTFLPGPKGLVLVRVAREATAYDHVLITEEPGNGSERPSGDRVAESDL